MVTRTVSDADARSRRVALTPKGLRTVDDLVEKHVANEHRLIAGFTEREREELARLLEKWGRALDEL
jgi:DNA-binding MarR family transcriptional regulator